MSRWRHTSGGFRRISASLLVAVMLAGCGTPSAHVPDLLDLDGQSWRPLDMGDARAHVFFFITVDCPISNAYAPEIGRIVADHRDAPVRFFLVHVDPDVTSESARQHAADYALPHPVLRDPQQRLANALEIRTTPEVAVVTADGDIAYRGRIDNWWGDLGRKRPRATKHELRDAVRAVIDGDAVVVRRTEAIGCSLPAVMP